MADRINNTVKGIGVFAIVAGGSLAIMVRQYDATPEGQNVLAKQAQLEADQPSIDLAETLVKVRLRDPDSAVFSGTKVVRRGGKETVCGFVNARNGFGGMTGDRWFAVVDTDVLFMDESLAASTKITSICPSA